MFKEFVVKNLPFLGRYKRFAVALYDNVKAPRTTYSQHQEDEFIWEKLKQYDLEGSVYVDVGANHPSDISNSYLLYRNGLKGIVVEPNEELIALFRKFRRNDVHLMIGCSNINTILKFNISKTPVISSFSGSREVDVYKSIYVPVMRLDDALQNIPFEFVSFLSIDVEGLTFEVLEGAQNTLKKSLLVCLEYDTDEEKARFIELLGENFFVSASFGCNLIFENKAMQGRLRKKAIQTVNTQV